MTQPGAPKIKIVFKPDNVYQSLPSFHGSPIPHGEVLGPLNPPEMMEPYPPAEGQDHFFALSKKEALTEAPAQVISPEDFSLVNFGPNKLLIRVVPSDSQSLLSQSSTCLHTSPSPSVTVDAAISQADSQSQNVSTTKIVQTSNLAQSGTNLEATEIFTSEANKAINISEGASSLETTIAPIFINSPQVAMVSPCQATAGSQKTVQITSQDFAPVVETSQDFAPMLETPISTNFAQMRTVTFDDKAPITSVSRETFLPETILSSHSSEPYKIRVLIAPGPDQIFPVNKNAGQTFVFPSSQTGATFRTVPVTVSSSQIEIEPTFQAVQEDKGAVSYILPSSQTGDILSTAPAIISSSQIEIEPTFQTVQEDKGAVSYILPSSQTGALLSTAPAIVSSSQIEIEPAFQTVQEDKGAVSYILPSSQTDAILSTAPVTVSSSQIEIKPTLQTVQEDKGVVCLSPPVPGTETVSLISTEKTTVKNSSPIFETVVSQPVLTPPIAIPIENDVHTAELVSHSITVQEGDQEVTPTITAAANLASIPLVTEKKSIENFQVVLPTARIKEGEVSFPLSMAEVSAQTILEHTEQQRPRGENVTVVINVNAGQGLAAGASHCSHSHTCSTKDDHFATECRHTDGGHFRKEETCFSKQSLHSSQTNIALPARKKEEVCEFKASSDQRSSMHASKAETSFENITVVENTKTALGPTTLNERESCVQSSTTKDAFETAEHEMAEIPTKFPDKVEDGADKKSQVKRTETITCIRHDKAGLGSTTVAVHKPCAHPTSGNGFGNDGANQEGLPVIVLASKRRNLASNVTEVSYARGHLVGGKVEDVTEVSGTDTELSKIGMHLPEVNGQSFPSLQEGDSQTCIITSNIVNGVEEISELHVPSEVKVGPREYHPERVDIFKSPNPDGGLKETFNVVYSAQSKHKQNNESEK